MSTNQKFIIIKDRVEIYKDFTINLLNYIVDFYLDKQTLSEDTDIRNHYNWCYNKVCDEFKLEGIDFSNNVGLRDYFYEYYYNQFYKKEGENDNTLFLLHEKFWRNIFDIEKQKNKSIINILVEVYSVFDLSINQEKNILEIV